MSDPTDKPEPALPLTADSPIFWAEELIDHVELRRFYAERGIKCFACCAAEAETFAQGARVHAGGPFGAFDAAKLVEELNALARKHPFKPETAWNPGLFSRVLEFLFPAKRE
ncbi:MAG: hypothetical protein HS108_14755 [Planctomycetes bacterium]|jgi:hypothetical protein|nr:hypothetical protein [Planctomycetota bacterium]MCL4730299.1 hypothetical protein [Planctomycetota bacterium]